MPKPNGPVPSGDAPRCEECEEAPATYIHDYGALLCSDCACWQGAVTHGERFAALHAVAFAVQMMRQAHFSGEQIGEAFERVICSGGVPDSLLPGERPDERWLRDAVPLGAIEGVTGGGA
jgi:hypothetical protein